MMAILGHTIFRHDSPTTVGYAGVSVYVREDMVECSTVKTVSIDSPGLDNVFVDVYIGAHQFLIVGCICRPRPSVYVARLCEILNELSADKRNLFVAGDFYMSDLHWPLNNRIFNSSSGVYADIIRDSNLSQLVTFNTRFRDNQCPSLPDLILVNDSNLVSTLDQQPPIGKFDYTI